MFLLILPLLSNILNQEWILIIFKLLPLFNLIYCPYLFTEMSPLMYPMTFLSPYFAPFLWLLVLLNSFLKLSFLVFVWWTSVFELFLTDFSFHACLTCSSSSMPFLNITMSRHCWHAYQTLIPPQDQDLVRSLLFLHTVSVCWRG